MSSTTTKLMTADDLLALPTYVDGSDRRYELIRGELKVMSPAKPLHGIICGRLTAKLWTFVEEHGLGEVFGAETSFLVETEPNTVVRLLGEQETLDGGEVLPGFTLELAKLFAPVKK